MKGVIKTEFASVLMQELLFPFILVFLPDPSAFFCKVAEANLEQQVRIKDMEYIQGRLTLNNK